VNYGSVGFEKSCEAQSWLKPGTSLFACSAINGGVIKMRVTELLTPLFKGERKKMRVTELFTPAFKGERKKMRMTELLTPPFKGERKKMRMTKC